RVCVRQRISHFAQHPASVFPVQPLTLVKPLAEVLAIHESHHEIHQAFALVHAEDRDDVRMAQLSSGLGLLQEASTNLASVRKFGWQKLDRHQALESQIPTEIHDTHAATPDF